MTGAPLVRSMKLLHATTAVVGIIVGASIFVQPSEITREVPHLGGILLVWIVAGLLTMAGALICAELASAWPRTGGVYVFLRETLSPAVAFLWGWAMFWSMHSGIIAAVAVVFARYLAFFVPLGDTGIRAVAILAILAMSAVNYVGVKYGARLQAAFTVAKLVAVALLIAAGFALGSRLPAHFVSDTAPVARSGVDALTAFIRALGAGLFAFGGWHMVTYTAEETVDPERTIPRALVLGVSIVIACYVALNGVYLYVLPLGKVIVSQRIAADAADAVLGSGGAGIVSALVVFSTIGALGGLVLAGPRVYYAMAQDGLLFRWVAEVHPRFRTPARAILLQGMWSSALVATGTYRALFTRVVYTEWIFFGLMAFGLVLARRRASYAPRYRMWGYPVIPAVFALAALMVAATQIVTQPAESITGLLIVAAGLPVYYLWGRSIPSPAQVSHAEY
jgi:basic amino acid/polyamine antiporter, APA family